jgi:hypothetical protein
VFEHGKGETAGRQNFNNALSNINSPKASSSDDESVYLVGYFDSNLYETCGEGAMAYRSPFPYIGKVRSMELYNIPRREVLAQAGDIGEWSITL